MWETLVLAAAFFILFGLLADLLGLDPNRNLKERAERLEEERVAEAVKETLAVLLSEHVDPAAIQYPWEDIDE